MNYKKLREENKKLKIKLDCVVTFAKHIENKRIEQIEKLQQQILSLEEKIITKAINEPMKKLTIEISRKNDNIIISGNTNFIIGLKME